MVRGGMETQTSSVADKYLRDTVRDAIWQRNTVTFPDDKQWQSKQKWLESPDPQAHEDTVRYLTYGCVFSLVDGVDKRYQTFQADPGKYPTVWVCMCTRKYKQTVTQTCRSQVTVSGQGFSKHTGQVQVSGHGVPEKPQVRSGLRSGGPRDLRPDLRPDR
jgi:hypothetical protein